MRRQHKINFFKITPGGNPTILLDSSRISAQRHSEIAAAVMSNLHLGAEQVAFVDWAEDSPGGLAEAVFCVEGSKEEAGRRAHALPHLNMMGGEFCANACRAYAAFLAARAGALPWRGKITSSGTTETVECYVSAPEGGMDSAIGIDFKEEGKVKALDKRSCMVTLPGIAHIFIKMPSYDDKGNKGAKGENSGNEANLEPDEAGLTAAFSYWQRKLDLSSVPAVGCIFFKKEKDSFRIYPLVWVKATNTYCMETACGSASVALAMLAQKYGRDFCPSGISLASKGEEALAEALAEASYDKGHELCEPPFTKSESTANFYNIIQPCGEELWVRLPEKGMTLGGRVWLGGACSLVAKGDVYVDLPLEYFNLEQTFQN